MGGARFQVSDKTKGTTCRELFPAKSCLHLCVCVCVCVYVCEIGRAHV